MFSLSFWRNLLRRNRVERDLDDELRATVELIVDEKVHAGMAPDEARRAARVEVGALEAIKDNVRDARAGALVETLAQDVRYGLRTLSRSPLFAVTAFLSMAVGIAAPTAIFTIANGVLLRPAAGISDASTLVDIVRLQRGDEIGVEEISYPDYLDIRQRVHTLHHVYGYRLQPDSVSLVVDGSTQRVFATVATTNYFEALGVRPAAGRLFGRDDSEREGASPVAVLSHRFWTWRFGADPTVIGHAVRINGEPFVIVGVVGEEFRGTSVVAPDLWIPASMVGTVTPDASISPLRSRHDGWLMLGARLAPGASRRQASAEVGSIGEALAREFPMPRESLPPRFQNVAYTWSVESATPIPAGLRILAATLLSFLVAVVSILLVIACANVAGILLMRASLRRREIALRTAVGAGRRRIVRQLLTETALLVMIAGVAGLFLARLLTSLALLLLPAFPIPVNVSTPLDGRVVAFTLGLSALAALLTGLAPAWQASRLDVIAALKDEPASGERMRLRRSFVVAQVAFSVLLVVVAAALVRGLDAIAVPNSGYDERGLDVAMVDLSLGGYTNETGRLFIRELSERVRRMDGVESSTIASPAGSLTFGGISVPGVTPPDGAPLFYPNWTLIDAGYFATLGIPLVAGRDIGGLDSTGGEPVAIVNESTARRFWPGRNPIGEVMEIHRSVPDEPPIQLLRVVGVVRDAAPVGAGKPPVRTAVEGLALYVPLQQYYSPQLRILTRTRGERSLAEDLRALLTSLDPVLPVLSAQTLESQQSPMETQLRIGAMVTSSVGVVGMLLAAMGVYGVTAYAVSRRRREIGIRISLGAGRGVVILMVLWQGMRLVAIGSGIGLLLGIAAGTMVSGRFNIPGADAPLLAVVVALFATIGLAACYLPARHASGVRAMDALRSE